MKREILFIFLALILVSCASPIETSATTSYQLPDSVDVTFNALLPTNHPAGEPVLFTILDDVTGLEFNPRRLRRAHRPGRVTSARYDEHFDLFFASFLIVASRAATCLATFDLGYFAFTIPR